MSDKFIKVILSGILICLMAITFKLSKQSIVIPTPNVNIDNNQQFLQIAPNSIRVTKEI